MIYPRQRKEHSLRIILESPCEGIKTQWKKPQKPIRNVPSQEQFEVIVANVRSQKFSADAEDTADFLELLGLAGLGQAEASALTWGDVDWGQQRLQVRRQKTQAIFKVPLYPDLRPLLERLFKKYPIPPASEEKVFKIKDAKKALSAACVRLGYKHFTQRNFRQVLILSLWRKNVDYKLIARWQGHQDGGKLILDTYTEVV